MYQNQSRSLNKSFAKSSALALIFTATAAFTMASAPSASASASPARQVVHQTHIDTLGGSDVDTIDWRQPEMKLRFDLTSSDWIDGIEFILSMDPGDNVNRRAPILVSLNNAPPVKLTPKGRAFDARISLDSDYARPSGNVITISYPASSGACLSPQDGSWLVNTKKSSVIARMRGKSRALYLDEVEDRLSNPVLAPKTVGIIAAGAMKDRLEVLGAQGIGLRMDNLPAFRTTRGKSGMDVIIGRRAEISRHVGDRDILNATGPKISVAKGRPLRLVITGDTDAQVLSATKLFAQRHLPSVRRAEASEGELHFQRAFADNNHTLSGKTKLSDMGFGFYARDWTSTPNTVTFNVEDPNAQSGQIMLRLSSSEDIADVSKLDVSLNGHSLGFTTLDKPRKTVAFDIPRGALQGMDNKLVMTPTFSKAISSETSAQTDFTCPTWDDAPGFYMGKGSRIDITSTDTSPVTELSRLTAGSGPFAQAGGADTHIVLATSTRNDRAAALKLVAKLAKASGTGWAEATVSSLGAKANIDPDRNVLILGPRAKATGLLDDAPRTLNAALRGQPTINVAGNIEKFASNDVTATMNIYAAKQRSSARKNTRGGIAAIYPSQTNPGTLTAVFSTTPGSYFSTSVKTLTADKVWNGMSGSVARWNKDTVLMAQTAIPAPEFKSKHAPSSDTSKFKFASLDFTQWNYSGIEDGFLNMTDKARDFGTVMVAKLNLDQKEAAEAPLKTANLRVPPAITAQKTFKTKTASVKAITAPPPILTADLRGLSNPKELQMRTQLQQPRLWHKIRAPFLRKTSAPDRVQKAEAPMITIPQIKVPQVKVPEIRKPKIKEWVADAKAPVVRANQKWNTSKWERSIRDVQAKFQPIGAKIKNTVGSDRNPIKGLMIKADRTLSYFGILLALAFIFSILLLGLATPNSEDTKHL